MILMIYLCAKLTLQPLIMNTSNFEMLTNSPHQNDILNIQMIYKNLDNQKFKLISLSIVGILEHQNEEYMFLQSVPAVLTVLNTIKHSKVIQNINFYIPKNVFPTYHTKAFDISYYLLLNITCDDNSSFSIKKRFLVKNSVYDHLECEDMIIIDDRYCQVVAYDSFRTEYLNIIKTKMMKSDPGRCKFLTSNTNERLSIISKYVKDTKITDTFVHCQYTKSLDLFKSENTKLFPFQRTFTIKEEEKTICEIKIDDILFMDTINMLRFKFMENVKELKIKIQCDEKETQYGLTYEHKIYTDTINMDLCVEKRYELFLPNLECFTFSCSYFISTFTLKLDLDGNEFEIPIKVYSKPL